VSIKGLNTLKRGSADIELDADTAITELKSLTESASHLNFLDLCAIAYSVLYLLQNLEYSVREFAEHAYSYILKTLEKFSVTE
jgi:hypothetical protein